MSLATSQALQIDGVKAAERAKRSVIKMTLKGAGRRIAYVAVQNELRQGIRAVKPGSAKSDGCLAATPSNCPGLTGCNNKRAADDPTLSKRCA